MGRELRSCCQWNSLSEVACGNFNLMAFSVKSISQRSEERNVGGICEINPNPHFGGIKSLFLIFHF
jgi:hypothetical protein